MRTNLPVSQREYDFPADELLVSTTDTRGIIQHCNGAFERVSGFSREELTGQPHNLVRHPDMPPEAFADMWRTIGRSGIWTGIVKNRRKNGDHYWVQANVTPVMEAGQLCGYMSVRTKPTREQVREAEAVYARILRERGQRQTVGLHAGQVRLHGVRGWVQRAANASLTLRLAGLLLVLALLAMLPDLARGMPSAEAWGRLALLAVGAVAVLVWFQWQVVAAARRIDRMAAELAACSLGSAGGTLRCVAPLDRVVRSLRQTSINLGAVVGDVRAEVEGFVRSADDIAQGGRDLAARTEAQAGSLEQTAAAMEQLASTVQHSAEGAADVSRESTQSTALAQRGGEAVRAAGHTMQAIEQSSRRVEEIVQVIEGIAFQTNILALNAAVEAARAGEQGRGFAVVAAEVRALAQRSATAAREIGHLIGASNRQVAEGVRQMQDAGATIEQVVESVARVDVLVGQISVAAREQAQGIAQVNAAVEHLDGMTQHNAALVEQSAASAAGLEQGAHTLLGAVRVFHFGRP